MSYSGSRIPGLLQASSSSSVSTRVLGKRRAERPEFGSYNVPMSSIIPNRVQPLHLEDGEPPNKQTHRKVSGTGACFLPKKVGDPHACLRLPEGAGRWSEALHVCDGEDDSWLTTMTPRALEQAFVEPYLRREGNPTFAHELLRQGSKKGLWKLIGRLPQRQREQVMPQILQVCVSTGEMDIFVRLIAACGGAGVTETQLELATQAADSATCFAILKALSRVSYPISAGVAQQLANTWLTRIGQALSAMPYDAHTAGKATEVFRYIRSVLGRAWDELHSLDRAVWDSWACFLNVQEQGELRRLGWQPQPLQIYRQAAAQSAPLQSFWQYHRAEGELTLLSAGDLEEVIAHAARVSAGAQQSADRQPWNLQAIEGLLCVLDDVSDAQLPLAAGCDDRSAESGSFLHWLAYHVRRLGVSQRSIATLVCAIEGCASRVCTAPSSNGATLLNVIGGGNDSPLLQPMHLPLLESIAQRLVAEIATGLSPDSVGFVQKHWQAIACFFMQYATGAEHQAQTKMWRRIIQATCSVATLPLHQPFVQTVESVMRRVYQQALEINWKVLPPNVWEQLMLRLMSRSTDQIKYMGMPQELYAYLLPYCPMHSNLQVTLGNYISSGCKDGLDGHSRWLCARDLADMSRLHSIDAVESVLIAQVESDVDLLQDLYAGVPLQTMRQIIQSSLANIPREQWPEFLDLLNAAGLDGPDWVDGVDQLLAMRGG